jgi:hypothetical protein
MISVQWLKGYTQAKLDCVRMLQRCIPHLLGKIYQDALEIAR